MKIVTLNKSIAAALFGLVFFCTSCEKSTPEQDITLPIQTFSFWMFDSVEGNSNTEHFSLDRQIDVHYDVNVDKCYMSQNNLFDAKLDTFDRSNRWKRGYVNRNDLHHRIIFNGDTITIHHSVSPTIGNTNFRYTSGIKL